MTFLRYVSAASVFFIIGLFFFSGVYGAAPVAPTVKVFIPQSATATAQEDFTAIDVPETTFYTCRRMVLQPVGGDVIAVAAYYYVTQVSWKNPDGSAMLVGGKPMVSDAYLAVTYDANLGGWRDISGIGVDRGWTHAADYFVCSDAVNGERLLQAFAVGGSAQSYIYGTTQLGDSNVIHPVIASDFDRVVLAQPSWFFKSNQECCANIPHISVFDYVLNTQQELADIAVANTLSPTRAASNDTVVVQFAVAGPAIAGGSMIQEYNVSRSSVFAVINQTPQSLQVLQKMVLMRGDIAPSEPVMSSQSITPVDSASSSEHLYTQFVTDRVAMTLADYYVQVGDMYIAVTPAKDASGAIISNKFTGFIQQAVSTQSARVNQTGSPASSAPVVPQSALPLVVLADASKSSFAIRGSAYFSSSAQAQGSICFSTHSISSETSDAGGLVLAASREFFQGQCNFFVSSLAALQTVTKEILAITDSNPFPSSIYSFALNAWLKHEAERVQREEEEARRKAANKEAGLKAQSAEATSPSVTLTENYAPILFQAQDQKTYHGMLVLKTGFFSKEEDTTNYKAPHQYYEPVRGIDKFQLWYEGTDGSILQLSNDLSNSLMESFTYVSLADAVNWPVQEFMTRGEPFVGRALVEKTVEKISGWKSFKNAFKGTTKVTTLV